MTTPLTNRAELEPLLGNAGANGRFVVAVRTTRIYCLPGCRPARMPLARNVDFYATPSEAKAAGFRPCKLCRPDDWYAGIDPDAEAAGRIAALLAEPGAIAGVAALAEAAGLSQHRLTRICARHLNVTPGRALAEARITSARKRLIETDYPVTAIAFEVGYRSLSAFNGAFRASTGMNPTEFRQRSTT